MREVEGFEQEIRKDKAAALGIDVASLDDNIARNTNLIMVPDHRLRRLQHLFADMAELADDLSFTKLRRPVRRWTPTFLRYGQCQDRDLEVRKLDLDDEWIDCDCWWPKCQLGRYQLGRKSNFVWRPADAKAMKRFKRGNMPELDECQNHQQSQENNKAFDA